MCLQKQLGAEVYVGFSHVLKVIPYLLLDSILQLTLEIKEKCENACKIAKISNENGRTLHIHSKHEWEFKETDEEKSNLNAFKMRNKSLANVCALPYVNDSTAVFQ